MARCQWCTAPLPPQSGVCRYCGKRNDVDLQALHEFTVSRPDAPRICPACEIPMQTLDLGIDGTFYIERCEKCLSLFFDPNEVETLLEKSSPAIYEIDNRRLEEISRVAGETPGKIRYFKCPVCRTAMNRVNFGARSGVIVDQCPAHGMWLEGGELRRLLEWKKAGGQVLDRRRKAERVEEERRTAENRMRDEMRTRAEAGEFGNRADEDPFAGVGDAAQAAGAFVRSVLRLFR